MRILVIEDDLDVRDFLRASLEERCYTVDCTADGERGLQLAKNHPYDLILLDHILPKRDGQKICQDLRNAGKSTPIIMLTARNQLRHRVDALNAGADDYLSKPFSLEELLARMSAILRRSPSIEQNIMKIADLSLDKNKQKVMRGKMEIYLTRKEFSLLEYLMQRQETIISRSVLMEHIWNKDSDPFSNTLEAHIMNLRKKIDLPGKKKLIHNIAGRGYKIDIKK